ncbi:unnamed protein product [Caenorhabditis angaria]|uniref:Uncharacterized protein n=1 Tax=Caenorhabditis angaria TaxID=860376 RepID=A0A9P1IEM8_9PELO|nr:unnamed protein product [Caenorhabditis angaria]
MKYLIFLLFTISSGKAGAPEEIANKFEADLKHVIATNTSLVYKFLTYGDLNYRIGTINGTDPKMFGWQIEEKKIVILEGTSSKTLKAVLGKDRIDVNHKLENGKNIHYAIRERKPDWKWLEQYVMVEYFEN